MAHHFVNEDRCCESLVVIERVEKPLDVGLAATSLANLRYNHQDPQRHVKHIFARLCNLGRGVGSRDS